ALKAFQALEFYVHADLFMNPSAEFADIVLPVTSPFESESLKVGFEISEAACSLVQLRRALVSPRGESRSDTRIIFDLACRMQLARLFCGRQRKCGLCAARGAGRICAGGVGWGAGVSPWPPRFAISKVRETLGGAAAGFQPPVALHRFFL